MDVPDGSDASDELTRIRNDVVICRRCPRLVAWREAVAQEKRAAFRDWEYWGRPVPGFGTASPWLLVVGLAPAAHGANRTGRMFTGDRSGDWLYRALFRAGLASQPDSTQREDGLALHGTYVTATARCAPPENRLRPSERKNCREYLEREIDAVLPGLEVVVALGGYAYRHVMRIFRERGWGVPSPMPAFGHGREIRLDRRAAEPSMNLNDNSTTASTGLSELMLVCSYHPSQQNTFTGTLTEEMFDAVWARCQELKR